MATETPNRAIKICQFPQWCRELPLIAVKLCSIRSKAADIPRDREI